MGAAAADRQPAVGPRADGFGALFGAFGVGAIVGAMALGRVRDRLSNNGMLSAAGMLYAAATAVIVLVPGFLAALATLVFAGLAWMAATSRWPPSCSCSSRPGSAHVASPSTR